MTTKTISDQAPILGYLPEPPDVPTRLALTNRLHGHTTSESFLPEGVWPELDELREEALRHRRQVVAHLEARKALLAGYAAEDKAHTEALRQAARDGATPPEDARTAPEQRDRERTAIEERLWAGVQVFAEHADQVIESIREHEDTWLADLRSRLEPAREKRRQAEALLAEAKAEEFRLHRLGRWVQTTADDDGFGRQPAPIVGSVPERVSVEVFRDSLERPWHRAKPWNGATSEAAA